MKNTFYFALVNNSKCVGRMSENSVESLNGYIRVVKVSSVLNNDIKAYGKQHLFDGSAETCWNSDTGSPQSIAVKFSDQVSLNSFEIMFQGGFAPNVFSKKKKSFIYFIY